MNPVVRAVWYIETHFTGEVTLDAVANVACVSRFHMSRAFAESTGLSLQRYIRGRRLTEAARLLANGAPDILTVALDFGYGSHEAFTRAFRDEFGITPEQVRGQRHTNNLSLMEAITMNETSTTSIEPTRLVDGKPLRIAGLKETYNMETRGGIPAQWQRFVPFLDTTPGRLNKLDYGLCMTFDESGTFEYMCGFEVSPGVTIRPELEVVDLPAQRYAVFAHRDHVSALPKTFDAIWSQWLPNSGYVAINAPSFELYGESFDPHTGMGGLEVWVPVQKAEKV